MKERGSMNFKSKQFHGLRENHFAFLFRFHSSSLWSLCNSSIHNIQQQPNIINENGLFGSFQGQTDGPIAVVPALQNFFLSSPPLRSIVTKNGINFWILQTHRWNMAKVFDLYEYQMKRYSWLKRLFATRKTNCLLLRPSSMTIIFHSPKSLLG